MRMEVLPLAPETDPMPMPTSTDVHQGRMTGEESTSGRHQDEAVVGSPSLPVGDHRVWAAALRSNSPDLLLSLLASRSWALSQADASKSAVRLAALCRRPAMPLHGSQGRHVGVSDVGLMVQQHQDGLSHRGHGCLSDIQRQQYARFLLRLRGLFPSRSDLEGHENGLPANEADRRQAGPSGVGIPSAEAVRLLHSLAVMGKCDSAVIGGILEAASGGSVERPVGPSSGNREPEIDSLASWVRRLPSWQCMDLCWSLATLRHRPPASLLRALFDRTLPLLPSLGFSRASSLLWSLSRLRGSGVGAPSPSPTWWSALEAATQLPVPASSWMSGKKVKEATLTMTTLSQAAEGAVSSHSAPNMIDLDVPNAAADCSGGSTSANLAPERQAHQAASSFSSSRNIPTTPGQAVALIWSAAHLAPQPRPSGRWVHGLLGRLGPRLADLSARERAMLLTGLAKLRYKPPGNWAAALLLQREELGGPEARTAAIGELSRSVKQRARVAGHSMLSSFSSGARSAASPAANSSSSSAPRGRSSAGDYEAMLRSAALLGCDLPDGGLDVAAEIMLVSLGPILCIPV